MRLCVLVNDRRAVRPEQTTAALATRAFERGHQVWLSDVKSMALCADGQLLFNARAVASAEPASVKELVMDELVEGSALDAVLIRTNPARDRMHGWAHDAALWLLARASEDGLRVLNTPAGLRKASNKLYLAHLDPQVRPRTAYFADPGLVPHLGLGLGSEPLVLKPVNGTWGRDVFKVGGEAENLSQILDVLTRSDYAVVQQFLPEASHGDTRVITVGGRVLEVDGKVAAVRRIPSDADFRSNVHAGGRAAAAGELTVEVRDACARVAAQLEADGIWMAGLDFIGTRVVEVNVFSPGGLPDAGEFSGVDFVAAALEAFEGAVASPPQK